MSNKDFMPAEAFSVWEYISDELEARGWTREEMAKRMGGDINVNLCALDFLEHLPYHPKIRMGQEMADLISVAFGQDPQTWVNLDAVYYRWCEENPHSPEVATVLEHVRNRTPPTPA